LCKTKNNFPVQNKTFVYYRQSRTGKGFAPKLSETLYSAAFQLIVKGGQAETKN